MWHRVSKHYCELRTFLVHVHFSVTLSHVIVVVRSPSHILQLLFQLCAKSVGAKENHWKQVTDVGGIMVRMESSLFLISSQSTDLMIGCNIPAAFNCKLCRFMIKPFPFCILQLLRLIRQEM